jgi:formiminotetrahydrofolate cyclodeaminase
LLNVRINLTSIQDPEYVAQLTEDANFLEASAIEKEQKLLNQIKDVLK